MRSRQKNVQVEKSQEKDSLLVAANMTGEKLPLLVIGKAKNPRCLEHLKILPLDYDFNLKAWMTSAIFERYIRKLDRKFTQQKRKIALILDNCTAHPHISNLDSIKLVFLPPNTTVACQPMDAGVIRCLKAHYRSNLARARLIAFEDKREFSVDAKYGMELLKKSWSAVSESTIRNCFRKVGFVAPRDEGKF